VVVCRAGMRGDGSGLRMGGSAIWIVILSGEVWSEMGSPFSIKRVFGFECRWFWATGYNLDWCDCLSRQHLEARGILPTHL
jgi:hypothetical protein